MVADGVESFVHSRSSQEDIVEAETDPPDEGGSEDHPEFPVIRGVQNCNQSHDGVHWSEEEQSSVRGTNGDLVEASEESRGNESEERPPDQVDQVREGSEDKKLRPSNNTVKKGACECLISLNQVKKESSETVGIN